MFGKIAAFEFHYQTRQPVFWVAVIIFGLCGFLFSGTDIMSIGLPSTIHENGPYSLNMLSAAFSLFYMFITIAFVANVVTRDDETGFGSIVRTTRIKKFDYLIGRFSGAVAAAILAFASILAGVFLGTFMPGLDPEQVGPNQWQNYAYAYFIIGVPNTILTAAIFFTVATMTRSMMGSYIASIVFMVGYFAVTGVLGQQPEFERLLAYIEPLGTGAYGFVTENYPPFELNTRLPPIEGVILWNRLIILGVSLVAVTLAFLLFRFSERGAKLGKAQKLAALADKGTRANLAPGELPKPTDGPSVAAAQFLSRVKFEMGQVFKSPAFAILVAIGALLSILNLLFVGTVYGTQAVPLTRLVISTITGNMFIISVIVATYYAGELVWRERDRKVAEIVDSSRAADWVFVIPKIVTITLVLISTLLAGALVGMGFQAFKGNFDFEIGQYLMWYVAPWGIRLAMIAILAVFIQVIVPHKFWGWGFMMLWVLAPAALRQVGLDHNLYNFTGWPGIPYSEFYGQGRFWVGVAWFQAYWAAFSVLLVVLSYALLRRGTETRLTPRLRRLPSRLKGAPGLIAAAAVLVFIGTGAYIFYNTTVLNDYRSRRAEFDWMADYERTLLKYEKVIQPRITEVVLNVDMHPRQPGLTARGTYKIENQSNRPLTQVHVRSPGPEVDILKLSVTGARRTKVYDQFGYYIFTFDRPLQPGETQIVTFETRLRQVGFRNSGNMTRIVENGSFITNNEFTPSLGVNRSGMLDDPKERADRGLARTLPPPRLGAPGADRFNYLRTDSGFVKSDITFTTDADQIPLAPGNRVSDVTRNGRRTARFVSPAPISHFFSFQSGRYAMSSRTHKGVRIAVYHLPQHNWNVERMMTAAEASLDYFQTNFSPYQFNELRFIEFPLGGYAQAFPGTMAWSENLGFVTDIRDPEKIDYVTYVAAHELAHQWWAHQIIGADEQGMTVLSETLAQYSALMVMEKLYGPDKIRKFLKYELDDYLASRGTDLIGEQPLVRVENQQYIHYQKGSLVMYLLKDRLGEDKVNAALRRVLAQFAFKNAPYPSSTVLVDALRAEAGADEEAQRLITDLFEKITLYDLKVVSTTVRKRADGRFDVTLSIEASKHYADAKGRETEALLDETFDIGLFSAEPGKKDFGPEDVIAFTRRPLKTGLDTVTIIADRAPTWVGVDPYNKRIDRDSDDNVIRVGSQGR